MIVPGQQLREHVRRGWSLGTCARCAAIVSVVSFAGGGLMAQPETVVVDGLRFRPLEQGIADYPLSGSNMLEAVDLRVPLSFDRVYRLESEPRLFGASPPTHYARMSGALTAVFPRSVYTTAEDGLLSVDIPAGTVYSIGGPLQEIVGQRWSGPRGRVRASNHVNRSAAAAPLVMTEQGRGAVMYDDRALGAAAPDYLGEPQTRTIWNNDAYRQQRIATLLNAERQPS